MNRLERIKDMQSRAKTSHLYDGHYNDDLGFVLSIIEQAEKDLSEIVDLIINEHHGLAWEISLKTYKTLRTGIIPKSIKGEG